jgi:hypothetical protein
MGFDFSPLGLEFSVMAYRRMAHQFETADNQLILESIPMNSIPPETLHGVFEHWMERNEWVF